MNIVMTSVPNPDIKHFTFTDSFNLADIIPKLDTLEVVVSVRQYCSYIRIEKKDYATWDCIKICMVDIVKSQAIDCQNITFTNKVITESEIQKDVEQKFATINTEIDELLVFLEK